MLVGPKMICELTIMTVSSVNFAANAKRLSLLAFEESIAARTFSWKDHVGKTTLDPPVRVKMTESFDAVVSTEAIQESPLLPSQAILLPPESRMNSASPPLTETAQ